MAIKSLHPSNRGRTAQQEVLMARQHDGKGLCTVAQRQRSDERSDPRRTSLLSPFPTKLGDESEFEPTKLNRYLELLTEVGFPLERELVERG